MNEWKRGVPAVGGLYWARRDGSDEASVVEISLDGKWSAAERIGTENCIYVSRDPEWFASREFFGPLEAPK